MSRRGRVTNADLPGGGIASRFGPGGSRPVTKCTDQLIETIVPMVKAGNHINVVCAHAGISETTWSKWMKSGRATEARYLEAIEIEDPDECERALQLLEASLTDSQVQHLIFFRKIVEAECEAEIRLVTQWNLAAKDDWRAGASFLAKRHPGRWADAPSKVEVSGPGGDAVEIKQAPGDLVRALATNPEARAAAQALLAATVPEVVPGMQVDEDLADEVAELELDNEGFAVRDFDGGAAAEDSDDYEDDGAS